MNPPRLRGVRTAQLSAGGSNRNQGIAFERLIWVRQWDRCRARSVASPAEANRIWCGSEIRSWALTKNESRWISGSHRKRRTRDALDRVHSPGCVRAHATGGQHPDLKDIHEIGSELEREWDSPHPLTKVSPLRSRSNWCSTATSCAKCEWCPSEARSSRRAIIWIHDVHIQHRVVTLDGGFNRVVLDLRS